MTPDAPCWSSIEELAAGYRGRRLSPVEVTRALLDRIGRVDGALRSYLAVLEPSALQEARESEHRHLAGGPRGPLDGVPISLKDLFDVAGVPTTAASPILREAVAKEDSAVCGRLRAAGAVIAGKANMHELAYGTTGVSPHVAPARNPWNVDHVAGGSSSGSAASVAAGLAFGSVGSETGASVRRPAAFCGVVGFKPTYGRISRRGMLPCAWSLDTVGVFARTVGDVAILAAALADDDRRDDTWREGSVARLRVGIPRAYLDDVEPEGREAFQAAVETLARLGAEVRELDLPEVRFSAVASTVIAGAESSAQHRRWLAERPGDLGADVRGRLYLGATISAAEYLLGQRARRLIAAALGRALGQVDVLAAPTAPGPAPRIADGAAAIRDRGLEVGAHHTNLVRLPSLLGLPAISVPCGWSRAGLPLGLQLFARPFDETTILGVARAWELAMGPARRPTL